MKSNIERSTFGTLQLSHFTREKLKNFTTIKQNVSESPYRSPNNKMQLEKACSNFGMDVEGLRRKRRQIKKFFAGRNKKKNMFRQLMQSTNTRMINLRFLCFNGRRLIVVWKRTLMAERNVVGRWYFENDGLPRSLHPSKHYNHIINSLVSLIEKKKG